MMKKNDFELENESFLLKYFLYQIGLGYSVLETFIKNGFDSLDLLENIDNITLVKMGIQDENDLKTIIKSFESLRSFKESSSKNWKEALLEFTPIISGNITTENLIVHSVINLKIDKNETVETFLNRATHINLHNKKIVSLENFNFCFNLQFLYLYDNKLISTKGLESLINLTHLYLQNNLIRKIEGMENLLRLRKLYLSSNYISCLEGLESAFELDELDLAHQKSLKGFILDKYSCSALSKNLKILILSEVNLFDPENLKFMDKLMSLRIDKNQINDAEKLVPPLRCLSILENLWISGNPLTQNKKYRDKIVLNCYSLQTLDDKKISKFERDFRSNLNLRLEKKMNSTKPPIPQENNSEMINLHKKNVIKYAPKPVNKNLLVFAKSVKSKSVHKKIDDPSVNKESNDC